MEQAAENMDCPRRHKLKRPLRCIVKLGGAAITWKDELEMINEKNLASVTLQLRQAMMSHSTVIQTMDWSKRAGTAELVVPDSFGDQHISSDAFIVVHGAGSFGHFQASKSGVHKGGLPSPAVTAGFVATRISVTSLNLEVVRALAKDGIPALGISPLASGWSTCKRNVENANISEVARIIDSGFIPVLHGDAVFDSSQMAGNQVSIQYTCAMNAVWCISWFVTFVNEDGSWSIVKPVLPHMNKAVQTATAAHDTTGGMATKISEAAMIAKLGIDVYIVQAGTDHSLKALNGEPKEEMLDNWIGTIVRNSKSF